MRVPRLVYLLTCGGLSLFIYSWTHALPGPVVAPTVPNEPHSYLPQQLDSLAAHTQTSSNSNNAARDAVMASTSLPPPPPRLAEPSQCVPLDAVGVNAAAAANTAGIVIVTFGNAEMIDFLLNWHSHLAALSLHASALMGATDAATARALEAAGARCFPLKSSIGESEAKWGSPGFAQMGRSKAWLLRALLTLRATVLFADADVVFQRDPLPYLSRQLRLGASLLFHTDGFGSSAEVLAAEIDGLEAPAFTWGLEMNTGLFLATPNATSLSRQWCDVLAADSAFANWRNDQQSLNELVRRGAQPAKHDPATQLFPAFDGTLRLGLLPSHLFPSGHVYFIQRAVAARRDPPYAVHLTFQNCDQSGKRHRMREAGLWRIDPPSYYTPPGGLLSFDPDLEPANQATFAPTPRNMRLGDEVVAAHFRLLNHQLLQVRTALAIASTLNRTLVLPRFLCGVETVTNFAHRGIRCHGTNGCATRLPYWCPADHVLRMHYWRGVMPQRPQLDIRYREFSALHQAAAPRQPPSLRSHYSPSTTLRVRVAGGARTAARACSACAPDGYAPPLRVGSEASSSDGGGGQAGAAAASSPESPSTAASSASLLMPRALAAKAAFSLELPSGDLSEAELVTRLAAHAERRLIHFDSLRPDALSVTLAPAHAKHFDETIRYLGGGFCCVEPEKRGAFGHFWYDLLWDRPHTDRWGRTWAPPQKPWVPTPGP